MPKTVILDARAEKEISKFPKSVRIKLWAYIDELKVKGVLKEPFAKKIKSKPELFEIRIKHQGAWRVLYAYLDKLEIILLSGFQKKTQKTPVKEIDKAIKRLDQYLA
ncbi:MAG TPA: type II toxin-antitoxin system RelE/ParE family toxin [Candidatus Woesebacteria bacterium]|nr:type II toxin-antitoxin system RelE/ParE family toxin [Candidatus Woesebacteria bacterium]